MDDRALHQAYQPRPDAAKRLFFSHLAHESGRPRAPGPPRHRAARPGWRPASVRRPSESMSRRIAQLPRSTCRRACSARRASRRKNPATTTNGTPRAASGRLRARRARGRAWPGTARRSRAPSVGARGSGSGSAPEIVARSAASRASASSDWNRTLPPRHRGRPQLHRCSHRSSRETLQSRNILLSSPVPMVSPACTGTTVARPSACLMKW